jgi:hypothetical protein
MKKTLLSALGLIAMGALSAQTIVNTNASDRNVVLEEFTGVNCTFCPDGHKRANELKAANPGRVVVSNIHAGGYANPGAGQPDFRTSFGSAIDGQSGLTGYPAGTVNRENFVAQGWSMGSGTAMSRGDWNAAAAVVLAEGSPVNIAAEATVDVQTREISVLVEVYYTNLTVTGTMDNLNVAILQNEVKGPQVGASSFYPEMIDANGDYNHNHMLRHLMTGQWGEELAVADGPFFSRTYTYTLPASINAIDLELGNLEVIAFIADDNQYIMTGDYAPITFTGITSTNDVAVSDVTPSIDKVCGTSIDGISFQLKNNGSATTTTVDYEISVNGTVIGTKTWNGSVSSLTKTTVSVDAIDISSITPASTYTVEINATSVNSTTDENTADNTSDVSLTENTNEAVSDLTVTLTHDRYAEEVGLKIMGSDGTVVYEIAAGDLTQLASNTTGIVTGTIQWSVDDCFTVELTDSYGDGMSWTGSDGSGLVITDAKGTEVLNIAGDSYASKAVDVYHHAEFPAGTEEVEASSLSIYPNPANNVITIAGVTGNSNITIYDVQGRMVLQNTVLNNTVDVSALTSGVYTMHVDNNGSIAVEKLSIVK